MNPRETVNEADLRLLKGASVELADELGVHRDRDRIHVVVGYSYGLGRERGRAESQAESVESYLRTAETYGEALNVVRARSYAFASIGWVLAFVGWLVAVYT